MSTACPHCGGQTNAGHRYCPCCTRPVRDFILCDQCHEPHAAAASVCPHCNHRPATEQELLSNALDLEVRATRWGAVLTGGSFTALLYPPIIRVCNGRINVKKWSLLGLRTDHQEIQVTRVASVRYTKGVFWGALLVETFGGASEDLSEKGLRQEDAKLMAEQLKACLKD